MHGLKQRKGASGIVAEVNLGFFHRFAGFDECGEVQNPIGFKLSQQRFDPRSVGDVGFNEIDTLRNFIALAVAKIVENSSLMACGGEEARDCAADVSGTSCN